MISMRKTHLFLECACTMCSQRAEVAERSLRKELFTVLISGCFFPVCQQFSVMIFILLLLCLKVNLCVCKNGAFTHYAADGQQL